MKLSGNVPKVPAKRSVLLGHKLKFSLECKLYKALTDQVLYFKRQFVIGCFAIFLKRARDAGCVRTSIHEKESLVGALGIYAAHKKSSDQRGRHLST